MARCDLGLLVLYLLLLSPPSLPVLPASLQLRPPTPHRPEPPPDPGDGAHLRARLRLSHPRLALRAPGGVPHQDLQQEVHGEYRHDDDPVPGPAGLPGRDGEHGAGGGTPLLRDLEGAVQGPDTGHYLPDLPYLGIFRCYQSAHLLRRYPVYNYR